MPQHSSYSGTHRLSNETTSPKVSKKSRKHTKHSIAPIENCYERRPTKSTDVAHSSTATSDSFIIPCKPDTVTIESKQRSFSSSKPESENLKKKRKHGSKHTKLKEYVDSADVDPSPSRLENKSQFIDRQSSKYKSTKKSTPDPSSLSDYSRSSYYDSQQVTLTCGKKSTYAESFTPNHSPTHSTAYSSPCSSPASQSSLCTHQRPHKESTEYSHSVSRSGGCTGRAQSRHRHRMDSDEKHTKISSSNASTGAKSSKSRKSRYANGSPSKKYSTDRRTAIRDRSRSHSTRKAHSRKPVINTSEPQQPIVACHKKVSVCEERSNRHDLEVSDRIEKRLPRGNDEIPTKRHRGSHQSSKRRDEHSVSPVRDSKMSANDYDRRHVFTVREDHHSTSFSRECTPSDERLHHSSRGPMANSSTSGPSKAIDIQNSLVDNTESNSTASFVLISLLDELDTEPVSDTELQSILSSSYFNYASVFPRERIEKGACKTELPDNKGNHPDPQSELAHSEKSIDKTNADSNAAFDSLEKLSAQIQQHFASAETWDLNGVPISAEFEDFAESIPDHSIVGLATPNRGSGHLVNNSSDVWEDFIRAARSNLRTSKIDPSHLATLDGTMNYARTWVPIDRRADGFQLLQTCGVSRRYFNASLLPQLGLECPKNATGLGFCDSSVVWNRRSPNFPFSQNPPQSPLGSLFIRTYVYLNSAEAFQALSAKTDTKLREHLLGLITCT